MYTFSVYNASEMMSYNPAHVRAYALAALRLPSPLSPKLVPMESEPSKFAPPVEKTSRCVFPSEGWWSEDGDQCWLPLWYGTEEGSVVGATRVKRLAFTGHKLPTCPARDGVWYDDITVKLVWIRLGEPDEEGWAGSGADSCFKSGPFDPRSYPAWEVTFG